MSLRGGHNAISRRMVPLIDALTADYIHQVLPICKEKNGKQNKSQIFLNL